MHHTTSTLQSRALGNHAWRDHAACSPTPHHQVDPELFFPGPDQMDRIREAKALCAQCPVRKGCLDAALDNGDAVGIRGGMTEEEREPLHKKMEARLDYARVNETLAGRDVYLTKSERRQVVRAAFEAGVPTDRLATMLKITEEHAKKQYRRTRREIRNRAADQQKKADRSKTTASISQSQNLEHPQGRVPARADLGAAA
ncbi:WhiB family transcriptional regulator [Streptomyces sp. NPDC058067]|uniref:WhiB family transcriptional regulator n=1 Tax=Streptomyces sp. NPDC058067 TaxID=3346324 RepID=UPI0036EF88A2